MELDMQNITIVMLKIEYHKLWAHFEWNQDVLFILKNIRRKIKWRSWVYTNRDYLVEFVMGLVEVKMARKLDIGDDPKVYLAITIHLKLNGYVPKYSIEYLKNINTGEKQKASHSKNDLLNGGGEGGIRTLAPR